jgi:hypothetical protein
MPVANSSENHALGNSSPIALPRAGLEVGTLSAKSTDRGLQNPGLRVPSDQLDCAGDRQRSSQFLTDFALRAPNFIPARRLRSPITLKSRVHVPCANSPRYHSQGGGDALMARLFMGNSLIQVNGINVLNIFLAHRSEVANLAFPDSTHKDPFDRLIVAQSKVEDIPVLSIDRKLDA